MRVLAADDDEQVRDILSRLLSRIGVEAVVASSGEEAFAAFNEALRGPGFDAAFADLGMPWRPGESREGGGFALVRAIRDAEAASGSRPMRIIALTGADRRDASAGTEPGFDLFLQKPVGLEELRTALGFTAGPSRRREGSA